MCSFPMSSYSNAVPEHEVNDSGNWVLCRYWRLEYDAQICPRGVLMPYRHSDLTLERRSSPKETAQNLGGQ